MIGRSAFEADHERLIAWLLDPLAPHNLGPPPSWRRRCSASGRARMLSAPLPGRNSAAPGSGGRSSAKSRPNIVVEASQTTLVIELKINAEEGEGQTSQQADDYADVPGVIHVFLTLRDRRPSDSRFLQLLLRDFAVDLRRVLDSAPEPASAVAARGRTVAADYLATLERMLGMNPWIKMQRAFGLSMART